LGTGTELDSIAAPYNYHDVTTIETLRTLMGSSNYFRHNCVNLRLPICSCGGETISTGWDVTHRLLIVYPC
jgi:hypothetical protein